MDGSNSDPRHLRALQLPGPSWYPGPALAAGLEGLLAGLDLDRFGRLAGGLGGVNWSSPRFVWWLRWSGLGFPASDEMQVL